MIRIEIDCKIDTRGCSDNLDDDSNVLYISLLTPFLNAYLSILGDMIDIHVVKHKRELGKCTSTDKHIVLH